MQLIFILHYAKLHKIAVNAIQFIKLQGKVLYVFLRADPQFYSPHGGFKEFYYGSTWRTFHNTNLS